jgi:deoxyribonuclease IV
MLLLGAHVDRPDPIGGALATGSETVQIFLSPPRSWAAPKTRGDEEAVAESGLAVFVHASYLANPASLNPEVRAKARVHLQQQCSAAAKVGARGVVVHGGHPTGAGEVADGIAGWLEVCAGWEPEVPILIENTAGGNAAVARRFENFARLLEALRGAGHEVGVCLDTCHAWAGGEELSGVAERLVRFAGAVDLVHVNDSRDGFDSGRDRHANLGEGMAPLGEIVEAVAAAACPAVVETPGGYEAMRHDVEVLRERLGS